MRLVTPIDRILQAGGDGVTMIFWLLAIAGGLSFVLGPIPKSVSLAMSSTGITIYWMRFRNITLASRIERTLYARARDGDFDD